MNPLVSAATTTQAPAVPGAASSSGACTPSAARVAASRPAPGAVAAHSVTEYPWPTSPRHPRRQAGGIPRHRVEPPHRQRGGGGPLGDRRQRRDAGRAVAQEALEGHVQPREALTLPFFRSPRGRERLGQRRLLVEQLDRAVPDAARLHQHDLGPGRQEIGQHPRRVVEEREPRLHAVELLALGQVLPHRRPPGPALRERVGGRAQRRREDELAAPEERDGPEVVRRPLVADREGGQAVDLVAPEVDADGHVGRRGEDVDDAARARRTRRGARPGARAGSRAPPIRGGARRRRPPAPGVRPPAPSPPAGPSRCRMARTGATITRGGGGRTGSGAPVSAWSTARRRPIVSVSGLTRSKGRVSHAGSTATGPATAPTTAAPGRRRLAARSGRTGRRPAARRPGPSR